MPCILSLLPLLVDLEYADDVAGALLQGKGRKTDAVRAQPLPAREPFRRPILLLLLHPMLPSHVEASFVFLCSQD